MDYVIGGIAGAGATLVTNPMDVVKTRMQLQGELRARHEHTARYRGIAHALYVIARADGLMALQKGLVPAMLLSFSLNSIRLGLYHVAEVEGWTRDKHGELSMAKTIFWSGATGALSGVASNPVSVLKTRIQAVAHPSIAVGKQHVYSGTLNGFATIYRTEGIRGLFAGVDGTCAKFGVGSAAQLTTFSAACEYLRCHGYLEGAPITRAFVASLISGVLCAMIATPLDVVNTRQYNQGSGDTLYNGFVDCFRKVYKTEGVHGLYKGVVPLYLRLAPQTTVSLVLWDMLNNLLEKHRNKVS